MEEKRVMEGDQIVKESSPSLDPPQQHTTNVNAAEVEEIKKPWWNCFIEPGHAVQIVIAAAVAIAIGLGVSAAVGQDNIPEAAPVIIGIPGMLWLRALQAVVLPMIMCAMILAVQSLREISNGGAILARWTVGYYVLTTIVAIAFSIVMTSQVWAPLMPVADAESLDATEVNEEYADREEPEPHEVVEELFKTLIPSNIFLALVENQLLAIIVTSIVVGYLIKPVNSGILRAVKEVNEMIGKVIVFLIKLAPIGVFFLILPNMFRLDINEVGVNLGYLIGGSVSSMMIHLLVLLPAMFFGFTRKNPYTWWFKSSKAWVTAWGTASSAGTLPVTLRVCRERGVPNTIVDFTVPLGCLINMDGTSIYFPMVVVFLAKTQDFHLNAGHYIMILLLSTLAAIGTTPIPSSSLVLTVMIASSVGIPMTGMYAVVVAIDWFIDRFRTMVNVSGDIFAAGIMQSVTKITDPVHMSDDEIGNVHSNPIRTNDERV